MEGNPPNYFYGNFDKDDSVILDREEYEELIEKSAWLEALSQAGVDNWDGIDFAREIYETFNAA